MTNPKKIKKIIYVCTNCKKKFDTEYTGWKPLIKCIFCEGNARMAAFTNSIRSFRVGIKKYAHEPTAFWTTPNGKEVASDKNGDILDVSDTRYDLESDKHGWRATGNKVSELDEKGRPND